MKSKKYILHLLLLVAILFGGCAKQLHTEVDPDIVEGAPVKMHLSFSTVEMGIQTRASLTPEKEMEIESIAIYIFDETGGLVSQTIHENAGAHSSAGNGVLKPNGADLFPVETFAGFNRSIYVLANYHSNLIEGLRSVSNKAQFDLLVLEMLGNPIMREFGLCKVASITNQTITDNSEVKMELKYSTAKVTIKVINKCPDLEITGWSIDGIPMKSYVVERKEIASDPTFHDAVNALDASDFYYDFSDQNFAFEIPDPVPGYGDLAKPKEYASTFYMYENRRGGRLSKSLPPGWKANPATDPTDPRLKTWFAPEHSTRLRICGKSKVNGDNKSFLLNHYMGKNNNNDYNIERGKHYTYTITISGLNNINIDTNIEQSELHLEVRPPADMTSIDAHGTSRPFSLSTHEITEPGVTVTAEVLESASSTTHPDWLDISTQALYHQHVRTLTGAHTLWQQDGDDNTFVRPKHIPNMATRAKITYTPPAGVTLGSTEYPLNDTSLPYDKAHHRLCKQITNIRTKADDPTMTQGIPLFIILEEFPYASDATFREAVIRFTVNRPGQEPQYTRFTIRQYQPYAFASAPDASGEVILVERVEEYEHATHSYIPMNLQMTAGMQWGKYDIPQAIDDINGRENTLHGVYKDITSANYFNVKNYLSPKYGSLSGSYLVGSNFGEIIEGPGKPKIPVADQPGENRVLQSYTNALNHIYNMTAARYCHEKNRDVNGDGDIDASETVWYLPARAEAQLFWTYREVIKLKSDFYWTSTQANDAKAYALSMMHESSAPHLTYNGAPQALEKTFINKIGPPRARCIRRAEVGTSIAPIKPMVTTRSDGTVVVDCSNLPTGMFTTQSKMGIAQGNYTQVLQANKQVFKRFEVEKTQSNTSDYSTLHYGNGKCDATQGWRLPTQREMLLLYSVRKELDVQPGFEDFMEARYWTHTRELGAHYLVNFVTGILEYGPHFEPTTNQFRYRCVRELP